MISVLVHQAPLNCVWSVDVMVGYIHSRNRFSSAVFFSIFSLFMLSFSGLRHLVLCDLSPVHVEPH